MGGGFAGKHESVFLGLDQRVAVDVAETPELLEAVGLVTGLDDGQTHDRGEHDEQDDGDIKRAATGEQANQAEHEQDAGDGEKFGRTQKKERHAEGGEQTAGHAAGGEHKVEKGEVFERAGGVKQAVDEETARGGERDGPERGESVDRRGTDTLGEHEAGETDG